MKKIHLICNAHLDPVWQWTWQEGLGAALSTFRVAADFCEDTAFDGFVFNHNESLLYQWVEEYEPALFARIQALVAAGKWHIMGGWYIQPDCNMPSGESMIRQITTGRAYFKAKFGVEPTVAASMDAFGHSQGLVQILSLCGYKGYLYMRPDEAVADVFRWEGHAGTTVIAAHITGGYNTLYGRAREAIENSICRHTDDPDDMFRCWGIGDHGGGPSRVDLQNIQALILEENEKGDVEIIHSTPEAFFGGIDVATLPHAVADGLQPVSVGCYTSMNQVKRLHRRLEGNLASAEKTASMAEMLGLLPYPAVKIKEAYDDLLLSEFHDILPGSSVKKAEEDSVQMLYHGLYITDGIINRNLYALAAAEKPARDGDIPFMVLNPHPYEVTDVVECEYMLADQNWEDFFCSGDLYCGDVLVPSQIEKEGSNMPLDWRKRISFRATLAPMSVTRFDLRPKKLPANPAALCDLAGMDNFTFDNGNMRLAFDTSAGTVKSLVGGGKEYAGAGFGELLIYRDNGDAWRNDTSVITECLGKFHLLTPTEASIFAGQQERREAISPIQIVEDGAVRTCIEVLLGYNNSRARLLYRLNKCDNTFSVEITVHWDEKSRMLRFNAANPFGTPAYTGMDMFGEKTLHDRHEQVVQKWAMAADNASDRAVAIINDCSHGLMLDTDGIKISLLRSPMYTGHDLGPNRQLMPQARFYPRMEQGERVFNLHFLAGTVATVTAAVDIAAQVKNEPPVAVSYFPGGNGTVYAPGIIVNGARLETCKKSEDGKAYILRLFNNNGKASMATVSVPPMNAATNVAMQPFEVVTLRVENNTLRAVSVITEA